MRTEAEGLLAGFTALLLALLLLFLVQTTSFPLLPAVYPPETVSPEDSSMIGQRMSGFLWRYRGLDLIAQAVLLFASAVGCLAMLRRVEERR